MQELWTTEGPVFPRRVRQLQGTALRTETAAEAVSAPLVRGQLPGGHAPGSPLRNGMDALAHHSRRAAGPSRAAPPASPGYGENGEVDIWFPPSPYGIHEDNHELTADKPQDSFSSPQEVNRERSAGCGRWGSAGRGSPTPEPEATSLTEHLERLQWGAETVMPLFR